MKGCSASLAFRKTPIKMRYHFIPVGQKLKNLTMSVDDKDVTQWTFSYTDGGAIIWYSYFGNQYGNTQ